MRVIPNPTSGSFIIETGTVDRTAQIVVTNIYGQRVHRQEVSEEMILRLNPIGWNSGMYFVSKYEDGKLQEAVRLIVMP